MNLCVYILLNHFLHNFELKWNQYVNRLCPIILLKFSDFYDEVTFLHNFESAMHIEYRYNVQIFTVYMYILKHVDLFFLKKEI